MVLPANDPAKPVWNFTGISRQQSQFPPQAGGRPLEVLTRQRRPRRERGNDGSVADRDQRDTAALPGLSVAPCVRKTASLRKLRLIF
jgi:hypothetical protein